MTTDTTDHAALVAEAERIAADARATVERLRAQLADEHQAAKDAQRDTDAEVGRAEARRRYPSTSAADSSSTAATGTEAAAGKDDNEAAGTTAEDGRAAARRRHPRRP